ncbi:hypothetical protein BDV96DRAFT_580371 [Lophiotrema nucula]|uniref:C2H2-type domain-containing protein n=1 Tax=Lophiotrema nucula TaxID=690887 RepID=A0A6A5Z159_9PLEO|nr:hypothetical protein BDV96DRAFT_580371 [Lophiotrema nucula]
MLVLQRELLQAWTAKVCAPSCPKVAEFYTDYHHSKHVNRKHTRRYQCELCNSAFHLNADLRRHERTVHRNELSGAVEEFTCPNAECPIPGKVFVRKDNFERHVRGCGRSTMDV